MFLVRDLRIPGSDERHEDEHEAVEAAKRLVQCKLAKAAGYLEVQSQLAKELRDRIHVIVVEERHLDLGEWVVEATRIVWDSKTT